MVPSRRFRLGFTLIELLVVIAIIAILTAILLPVFATVRENARQSTSISNLKDIQQKMAQFKLDNHKYPDVLFGYSDGGPMKGALGRAGANAAQYFPGLYPAYIKDASEFTDPNNPVDDNDPNQSTGPLAVNVIAPCSAGPPFNDAGCAGAAPGEVVTTTRTFYTMDAYDSSPVVDGTNTLHSPVTYLTRYQTAWEPTGTADPNYNYQLRWQNPPAETFVTCTSYHVPNADKVLVLFENGSVKKMTGADFAAQESTGSVWKIQP